MAFARASALEEGGGRLRSRASSRAGRADAANRSNAPTAEEPVRRLS